MVAQIKYENEVKVAALKAVKMDINKLRMQITAIIEQQSLVQQSINRLHTATITEDIRNEVLQKEYDGLSQAYEQLLKNAIDIEDGKDAQDDGSAYEMSVYKRKSLISNDVGAT